MMSCNFVRRHVFQALVKLTLNSSVVEQSQITLHRIRPNCVYFINHKRSISTTRQSFNEYKITFVKASGDRITTKGKEGETLLDVVVNNNLDFDGFGACEGTLTCSTCHCIFKQEDYDKLPEKPSDEELDMLDLAYELSDTSRLGCQIQLSKDLDGVEVRLPSTLNDARG